MEGGCHVLIDLRDQVSFGSGHIPGSFGIGAGSNVSTWASWVVPYDTPLLLVANNRHDAEAAVRSLVRVGLDDVRGVIDGGVEAWRAAGGELERTTQIDPVSLAARLAAGESGLHVLDVRADDEWDAGHVAGAQHIMAGELAEADRRSPARRHARRHLRHWLPLDRRQQRARTRGPHESPQRHRRHGRLAHGRSAVVVPEVASQR